MKVDWNRKYTTVAVYAFLVILAGLIVWALLYNASAVSKGFSGLGNVLMPFTIGLLMAFLLNPLMKLVEKRVLCRVKSSRKRRKWSIFITYAVVVTLFCMGIWYIIPRMVDNINVIYNTIPTYVTTMDSWADSLARWFPGGVVPSDISNLVEQTAQTAYNWLRGQLPSILTGLTRFTSGLFSFILGVIISVYVLYDKELFFAQGKKVLYAILPERTTDVVLAAASDGSRKFSGFISGKILDSLIIGLMCLVGTLLLHIPYALLVSVVVGITNIIPYFGPFIGAIPSILFILTADPAKALLFAVFILALQQFDGNILGPRILGDSIGLSAIWVIFAILIFGKQFGLVGMVLGVPLFAVIYTAFKSLVEYGLWKKGRPLDTAEYASQRHPLIK